MFLQDKLGRRELLRIGALSVLGGSIRGGDVLGGDALAGAGPGPQADAARATASKPRNCIFLLLQGGPSHHDLWDPKPLTGEDIRGPFDTIATAMPGVRFGSLLPGTAKIADRLCIVRSMTHKFTNHIAGTFITLTGSPNQADMDRSAESDDFPGPGAVLNYLQKKTSSIPRSVSLPNWLTIPGFSDRMPGQYGGFLGSIHDPFLIEGNPNDAGYQPLKLTLPEGLNANRLQGRLSLVNQLDGAARLLERELNDRYDHLRQSAYDMVIDGRLKQALDLTQEPRAMRDRYGRTKMGQSLLVARRLIEAGVQFVAFNAYNQLWDTHSSLKGQYERIAVDMDTAYSALIEDLAARNLLDDTMVVNTGEFGRTPRMNKGGGRDHWPNVYSMVLAGGGFRAGHVHGQSDGLGAEVLSQPVGPADILATLYHQLGVSPSTQLHDRLNRPLQLSDGRVMHELLS